MTRTQLIDQIRQRKSFLCVGLDSDPAKIPSHLGGDVLAFNKSIVDATHDLCVSYKLNTAFYESQGLKGWKYLSDTVKYIRKKYPSHFVIADAKRGDIGNTSAMYASAFFEAMDCHALTVAPYMGEDSVKPFLSVKGKWTILLALTSNPGASDFQFSGEYALFREVIMKAVTWGTPENLMFVAGATRASVFHEIRKLAPEHFLLVPGIGAQGGSLSDVCEFGLNKDVGLLINASRSILYASSGKKFDKRAREEAEVLQKEMAKILLNNRIIE